MTEKEFHEEFSKLLAKAMSQKNPLPFYAVKGITMCTLEDLQIRVFLDQQRKTAMQFASDMADGAKPPNNQ